MGGKTKYIASFDYLRAIGCIFVVLWHTKAIDFLNILSPRLAIIGYYQILLLAVPTFILISLYLFLQQIKHRNISYLLDRLKILLKILVFWNTINFLVKVISNVYYYGYFSMEKYSYISLFTSGLNPAYYFLPVLISLFLITFIVIKFERFSHLFGFIVVTGWLFGSIALIINPVQYKILIPLSSFYLISNFLPYIVASQILSKIHHSDIKLRVCIIVSIFMYVLFSIFEQQHVSQSNIFVGQPLPHYFRPSILFGSIFLVGLCLKYSAVKAGKFIKSISIASFGIYLFHPVLLDSGLLQQIFKHVNKYEKNLIIFIILFATSYFVTLCYKYVFMNNSTHHRLITLLQRVLPPSFKRLLIQISIKLGFYWYSRMFHSFSLRPNTTDETVFFNIFIMNELKLPFKFSPKFIVDAGAYTGLSTLYYSKSFPKAKIISIEPENTNFTLLKQNTKNRENIHIEHAGVWYHSGNLVVENPNSEKWSFSVKEAKKKTKKSITAMTIPQILKKYHSTSIDILKLDIEGSEKELFSRSLLWLNQVKVIVIELHDWMKEGCRKSLYSAIKLNDWVEYKNGEKVILARKTLFRSKN